MRMITGLLSACALAVLSTGCAYLPGGTNLGEVAQETGLRNVTTGDGTFENYTATGHYSATEIGIGVGLPFIATFVELYPGSSNEQLLTETANAAKADGAEALINVKPANNLFTGIPFFIVGIYVDRNEGTGIDLR